jgi:hypothetical protein
VNPEYSIRQTDTFDVRDLGAAILPYLEYFEWQFLEEVISSRKSGTAN